jgi:hypothetical protein
MPDNFTCQGESAATQWVKCCTSPKFVSTSPTISTKIHPWYNGSCFGILDMHALIVSRFTYNQQDDDVTKKIEKYASPRLIYPLGPSKCTPCMMFVAEGMGVTKLKTVNILNAVICLHIMCIMLKV